MSILNATYVSFSCLISKDLYDKHGEQWVPQEVRQTICTRGPLRVQQVHSQDFFVVFADGIIPLNEIIQSVS